MSRRPLAHTLLTLLLATILCPVVSAAADPSLTRAMELEKSGEARQASDAYRAWLDEHLVPKDAATGELYVEALLRLSRIEPDARLVQHFLERAPLESLPVAGRLNILVALAELLDAVGDVEKAQAAYARAAAAEGLDAAASARYQLRSASLLYEEGRVGEAESRTQPILADARVRADTAAASAAVYLLGRIQAATGRPDEALASWRFVLDTYPTSALAPASAFGVYTLAMSLDRDAEAEGALELLTRRYPLSPERQLAGPTGKTRVSLAPRPTALLEPYLAAVYQGPVEVLPAPLAQVPVVAQPPPAEQTGADGMVVVLAGSYSSRENAERHAAQVTSRGFTARIVPVDVRGVPYYRVLVGDVTSRVSALDLSRRLKDKDLESTLLVVEGRTGG